SVHLLLIPRIENERHARGRVRGIEHRVTPLARRLDLCLPVPDRPTQAATKLAHATHPIGYVLSPRSEREQAVCPTENRCLTRQTHRLAPPPSVRSCRAPNGRSRQRRRSAHASG